MKILTIGTFDIPHMGHYSFLKRVHNTFASDDEIIVAVNGDEFVERFKGKKPIFNQSERMELLKPIPFIKVIANNAGECAGILINQVMPEVIAIGSDWMRKEYLEQLSIDCDFLESRKISLIYIPYTAGISTSEIKKRIK